MRGLGDGRGGEGEQAPEFENSAGRQAGRRTARACHSALTQAIWTSAEGAHST